MNLKALKTTINISFHAIFWFWNLTFLTIVYLGILPFVGGPLILATFDGDVPLGFFITLVILIAVPTVCTFVGARYFIMKPRGLMRLFYGVEAPLVGWCLIRLFIVRELTPASTLVLGTALLSICAFAVEIVRGYDANHKEVAWLQLISHSLMWLMGIYGGVVLLFYAIPSAGAIALAFFSFGWLSSLGNALYYGGIFAFLFVLLALFSCTLFVAMPIALTVLYLHSGQRVIKTFQQQYGRNIAVGGAVTTMAVWLVLLFSFNIQPQVQAFELLANVPQTDTARQGLLAESKIIRKGLVNAHLYPYRYLSTTWDNNHIYAMYKNVFGVSDEIANWIQNTYNQVMLPFLYQGTKEDVDKASELYAEFFDIPLQKAERQAVQKALQSTAIIDEAKAGLLNIDQPRVWLEEQAVTVKPHGDWADVELYEVYENKTDDVEEVFYYFSLPESAAITGVWLGESDKLDERFAFQVSPRGAAQKVYNDQVRRSRPIDPALLEQVGPRNYRLRAFPVPRPLRRWERRNGTQRATKMHLWLTYKVMRQEQGWALPKLAEKRNIFWTNRTKRVRNGEVQKTFGDTWLEDYISADQQQPQVHEVSLNNGTKIVAQPVEKQNYGFATGQKIAVILDSSRSMANHSRQLTETFTWLKQQGFADHKLTTNDADLYIPHTSSNQPQRLDDISSFDVNKIIFYGSIQPKEMLRQFAQLKGDTNYDSIILLSDEGSYELSDDNQDIPNISTPVWMIHLGTKMPSAYDDTTLKLIQDSQGGVAENIPTVMQRLANQDTVVDGYIWKIAPGEAQADTKTGFEPLAARQLVQSLSRQMSEDSQTSLAELDAIHAVAKQYDIVTPYSSMIVLVNDQQRQQLKEAESAVDRFDREVETGQENLNQPFDAMTVSAVPEPEIWLLLGVGLIALVLIWKRQQNLDVDLN